MRTSFLLIMLALVLLVESYPDADGQLTTKSEGACAEDSIPEGNANKEEARKFDQGTSTSIRLHLTFREMMSNIAKCVLADIPPNATWHRIISESQATGAYARPGAGGWLLEEQPSSFHLLTWDGHDVWVAKAEIELERIDLSKDVEHVRRTFSAADGQLRYQRILVAAWLMERGHEQQAKSLLRNLFDIVKDDRGPSQEVQQELGLAYYKQMFHALTHERDYATALRFARHLSSPPFESFCYRPICRQLVEQLPRRTEDFHSLLLPTPDEWHLLQRKLSHKAQIQYLCERLPLIDGHGLQTTWKLSYWFPQYLEPPACLESGLIRKEEATRVIHPCEELEKILTVDELRLLIPFLNDQQITLTHIEPGILFGVPRLIQPVRVWEYAAHVFNSTARRELIDADLLGKLNEAERKAYLKDVAERLAP